MIPIPNTLSKNGHRYRLLRREGDWCLWRLRVNGSASLLSYEVSRVVKHPAQTFPGGRVYPAREGLPADEAIGRGSGWCPSSIEEAERLFNEVTEGALKAA